MMGKVLIANSDDFGLNDSITDAIIETHLKGIMTSTTLMVNMPGFDYAVNRAKEIPTLGVGIHFNLTEGEPLSPKALTPDLVDNEGLFKENSIQRLNLLSGANIYKQVYIELKAQLEKMIDSGLVPSHFDSHHHITGVPVAFKASMEVAKAFEIHKARITNIDFHYTSDYKGNFLSKCKRKVFNTPKALIHKWNKSKLRNNGFKTPDTKLLPGRVLPVQNDEIEQFIQALSTLKKGITEICFHPGHQNSYEKDSKKMEEIRIRDFNIATSSIIKNFIDINKINLVSFKEL